MSDKTTPRPPDPHAAHRLLLPVGTPRSIGRYQVIRLLGGGTFGRVYLAFDPEIERYVAIKIPIFPPDSHHEFLREARVVAQLHHPNICPVYDVGVQEGIPFIVMRYVSGGTLSDVIAREPPTPAKALRIAEEIAKGLEAAHARGVFHRDLKPVNVLYDEIADGFLLTDFGIARLLDLPTTTGQFKGTPAYAAPEQWYPEGRFGPISARTDVYSLGALLFRLVSGVPLFTGTDYELLLKHCSTPPPRLSEVRRDLDPRLDDLCLKALAKQPADRYASAKEFGDAIAVCLRASAIIRTPATVRAPPVSLPSVAGEEKRQLTVPGTWYSRPRGDEQTEWKEIGEMPADITTQAGEVYLLNVLNTVRDADLAGLESLQNLTTLHTLYLVYCPRITDAGVAHVKCLTNLHTLYITGGTNITDAGVEHLAHLTNLRTLSLSNCKQITDASLAHLRSLTSLQSLHLFGCKQITDAGIAALKAVLSKCEIKH